jgi:hypothetical protein
MKHYFVLLLLVIPIIYAYSSGRNDIEYNNLGTYNVNLNDDILIINLLYNKPAGIQFIPNFDKEHIKIHQLILDGKRVKPKRKYFKYFMGRAREPGGRNVSEAGIEESVCYINMDWEIKNKGNFLYYESLTEKVIMGNNEGEYIIPYGTNEIKLIYSIRIYELVFDDQKQLINIITHETDKNYVKWELIW